MTSFIALYRGDTVSGAKLVALTADRDLVQDFGTKLLGWADEPDEAPQHGLRLVEQDQDNGA
jgi:hypothetical protein